MKKLFIYRELRYRASGGETGGINLMTMPNKISFKNTNQSIYKELK
jgi:hypothetical protein